MRALFVLIALLACVPPVAGHVIGNNVTIHMYAGFYEPRDLVIDQGDTVIFENADSQYHWPASNIHPTHEIYSDFDPKRGLAPGEQWSFRFTRPGSWRYHDHIYPEINGEIVVNEVAGFADDSLPPPQGSFLDALESFCVEIYYGIFPEKLETAVAEIDVFRLVEDEGELEHWMRIAGPRALMDRLLEQSGGGAQIDCHQPAHTVGRVAFKVMGAQVFSDGDASCHSGFYHGAIESFLTQAGTDDLAPKISELCSLFNSSFGRFECLHGVGHGVMAYEDYDLPRTIELCGELSSQWEASSCYGGAYMENVVAAQGLGAVPGHETRWVSDDPYFPCNALPADFAVQFECYQMQTSRMLMMTGYRFEPLVEMCARVPRTDMVPVCFKSFGRDAAGNSLRNPDKMKEYCEMVPAQFRGECIAGAVNVVVDFWGPRLEGQASEFCAILEGEERQLCYSIVAGRVNDVFTDPASKRAVCASFDEEFREDCEARIPD